MITPDKPLTIAGTDYVLSGSMSALKSIQQHFGKDIYDIAASGIVGMHLDELAQVMAFAIENPPALEVIEADIVQERGIDETKYLLMEWLVSAVSPKKEREKNVARLLEQIGMIRKATAAARNSRGKATKGSA